MKSLAALILGFTTLAINAAPCDGLACSGKTGDIASSLLVSSDDILLEVNADIRAKALSCELVDGRFIRLPAESRHFDSMHAVLLTAFAANAEIRLTLSPAQAVCQLHSIALSPAH